MRFYVYNCSENVGGVLSFLEPPYVYKTYPFSSF